MDPAAGDIPAVERLMRDVLRVVFEHEIGDAWLDQVPTDLRKPIESAAGRARRARPHQQLRDDWEAAGVAEMRALALGWWDRVGDRLAPIWPDVEFMRVDLTRILDYRGPLMHAVGPAIDRIDPNEIAGLLHRVRLGLEAVRRTYLDDSGQWFPYIEQVHSNIEWVDHPAGLQFIYASKSFVTETILQAGDEVTFEVFAVNPFAPSADLRYAVTDDYYADAVWTTEPHLTIRPGPGSYVTLFVSVKDRVDAAPSTTWEYICKVRPTLRT